MIPKRYWVAGNDKSGKVQILVIGTVDEASLEWRDIQPDGISYVIRQTTVMALEDCLTLAFLITDNEVFKEFET